jgi:hypothetical protein
MFSDACGEQFEKEVQAGADPKRVVPEGYYLAKGGTNPPPPPGEAFSASVGPTPETAAAAVPHGTIRITRVGTVRAGGGTVEWYPEVTRYGTINKQHVNVTEVGETSFGEAMPNPVPARSRVDGDRRRP